MDVVGYVRMTPVGSTVVLEVDKPPTEGETTIASTYGLHTWMTTRKASVAQHWA